MFFPFKGISYQKLDMSDWVATSDAESQIKTFKEAADIIDEITKQVNNVKTLHNVKRIQSN